MSAKQQNEYKKAKEYLAEHCTAGNSSIECLSADYYVNQFLDPHKDSVSKEKYQPGQVVDCVTSGSGKCFVTDESKQLPDYKGDSYE